MTVLALPGLTSFAVHCQLVTFDHGYTQCMDKSDGNCPEFIEERDAILILCPEHGKKLTTKTANN
jgi:hypothetical protein